MPRSWCQGKQDEENSFGEGKERFWVHKILSEKIF